jgi:hypothetical protein
MNYFLQRLAFGVGVTISIGISDAIEFFFNKEVHRKHNCPDIMNMQWKDYNAWYAFLSGVKCAWFLVIPAFLILPMDMKLVALQCGVNIILPYIYYFTNWQQNDAYGCHKSLYIFNTIIMAIGLAMMKNYD